MEPRIIKRDDDKVFAISIGGLITVFGWSFELDEELRELHRENAGEELLRIYKKDGLGINPTMWEKIEAILRDHYRPAKWKVNRTGFGNAC